ncbi:MAG: glycosyltransferase family 2 protein [Thomasclavelia sp.]|uniref:glycosyltransferase family 2 protein n=1 Tax=Thomasclavelia sp. TaxID=3025757 RepID=UPI0039A2B1BF
MKISVAMCTYRGERYITQQLNSILEQELGVDEIIICDDCSTDSTIKICQSILEKSNLSYKIVCNEVNMGFARNFYQAISLCTGDIIFFCDQDDIWLTNKTKEMIKVFMNNQDALLVFSNAYVTDEDLNIKGDLYNSLGFKNEFLKNQENAFKKLLNDNYVTGATSAIKRELLDFVGDLQNGWAHDYWFAIVAALYGGLVSIEEPLIYYRQHSSNTIGIGKKYGVTKIKQLFSKSQTKGNRENQYAELRLPLLRYLYKYMENRNLNPEYYLSLKESIVFWDKRKNFSKQGIIKNLLVVLKGAIHHDQINNRNTNKPLIKDFIKAIALSNRDK